MPRSPLIQTFPSLPLLVATRGTGALDATHLLISYSDISSYFFNFLSLSLSLIFFIPNLLLSLSRFSFHRGVRSPSSDTIFILLLQMSLVRSWEKCLQEIIEILFCSLFKRVFKISLLFAKRISLSNIFMSSFDFEKIFRFALETISDRISPHSSSPMFLKFSQSICSRLKRYEVNIARVKHSIKLV